MNSLSQPFVDDALLQRETQNWRSRLIDYKVLYEEAPEPFTPAPFILSGEVYRRMAQFLEPLASLVEKCVALYAVSPDVQRFFGFPKRLCQLVARQAAQSPPGWYCRFDFALSEFWCSRGHGIQRRLLCRTSATILLSDALSQ